MERVGNTGTSISIETAAKSERLWTFHSRKGVPSFLLVRKESGTERWGQERERTWSWRELARNGRTEWKRKRGRRERMTAGTRSLRSVLSELLLVTVARSCGGGSSITDSSYYDFTVFPFFFSPPVFAPWTQFFLVSTRRRFAHFLLGARLGFFFSLSLSLFSHPPSFTRTSVLVLIFHLRIVTTRGWKNWTNHGKWKWCFYVKIGLQSCLFRERRSIVREKICFVCRWKSLINLWKEYSPSRESSERNKSWWEWLLLNQIF